MRHLLRLRLAAPPRTLAFVQQPERRVAKMSVIQRAALPGVAGQEA
jgi:hypothetical protein